ncbi:hypothetical protein B5X24_HaOG202877 [Helicoverpa armigera]|nr:hypothetical protein B5X24_HaOG202877 [Helicoverpa armigera]
MSIKPLLFPLLLWCTMTSCKGAAPCKLRVYLARAEQTDENGLKCWDTVKVPACGGRCDSREISDWEFPFKKSHHPVCLYGSRRPLMVRLRHCDAGVATGTDVFHYIAAEECRCKVCSSEYTSCEWMPPNSTLMDGVDGMDFEDLEEEYNE